jgi:hypothetical protein
MNRFYEETFLNNFLAKLSEIDPKYLMSMQGETKSILFTELREVLGIDETKTFSKCYKQLDNLCDDLGAKLNIKVSYSKHSLWIWFNFNGEFKGYKKELNEQRKIAYEEYKKLQQQKFNEERMRLLASIDDGTYGINSKDKGGVYLISCGDFYKIGLSKDVSKRIGSIQTSNPLPVELVAKYSSFDKNYSRLESLLHEKFKDSRVRLEWFRKDFTKEDFIQACIDFCKKT